MTVERRPYYRSIHGMWPAHAVVRPGAEVTPGTVFGTRLRALRKAKGLTQALLGARAGVSQQAIGALEHLDHEPTLQTLRMLSVALNVPVAALTGLTAEDNAVELWQALDAALADLDAAVGSVRSVVRALAVTSACGLRTTEEGPTS